jgi:neutral ceramidase
VTMLRAAVTQVTITPPIGVELAGYGPRLDRFSTDIHDDLLGQALLLDDGDTRVALIAFDSLDFVASFTEQVRSLVSARIGLEPANILLACSHSHTSPPLCPTRDWGMPDPPYVDMVARHLAGAVAACAGKLQPVTVRLGIGEHLNLAWNRTGKDLVDPTLSVLAFDAVDGQRLAILVHFACHPVMLGPKSEISADYPGALRRYLSSRYPGATPLFMNGAAGDIDPVSNRDVWGKATFEQVEAAGTALGQSVERLLETARPIPGVPIGVQHGQVTLPYVVPSLEFAREQIQVMQAEIKGDDALPEKFEEVTSGVTIPRFWLRYWREIERRLLAGEQPSVVTAELQALHLGPDVVITALPAEVYTEQGLQMRGLLPDRHVINVCYANDMVGYIPTPEAFAAGSYASGLASAVFDTVPFAPDVAERLVDSVRTMLTG